MWQCGDQEHRSTSRNDGAPYNLPDRTPQYPLTPLVWSCHYSVHKAQDFTAILLELPIDHGALLKFDTISSSANNNHPCSAAYRSRYWGMSQSQTPQACDSWCLYIGHGVAHHRASSPRSSHTVVSIAQNFCSGNSSMAAAEAPSPTLSQCCRPCLMGNGFTSAMHAPG